MIDPETRELFRTRAVCEAAMNLRTFSAPTFAQAMALLKSEMGGDAVILHTRKVRVRRWMGLRTREVVEITAGSGLNVASRGIRRQQAGGGGGGGGAMTQAVRGRVAREPMQPRPSPVQAPATQQKVQPGKEFLETPAANRAMMMSISSEVRELRGVLEDLVKRT